MAPRRKHAGSGFGRDRAIVLSLSAAVLLAIVLFSAFGPGQEDNDPEPTTYNSGSRGVRAAFLLLSQLGYNVQRWQQPASFLANVDAPSTTLVLPSPILPIKSLQPLQQQLQQFMQRGGTIIATGPTGARLLPGGETAEPTRLLNGLCFTEPEGSEALARAGQVVTDEPTRWSASGPQYHVEQRCGNDAVVIRYRVGAGQAIWWASPRPLSNAGLSNDANLRLLLASLGASGRTVLFDEYLHQTRESLVDTLHGLPWWSLAAQCALLGCLLVLSRGRRNGPLRRPLALPRTSPVEFAESMGRLYASAGATPAATGAARARLLEHLREQCGISREILEAPAPALSQALSERYNGDWTALEHHLQQAREAEHGTIAARSALKLVQSLEADHRRLIAETQPVRHMAAS